MTKGSSLLSKAYSHPFNQQLHKGTLPGDTFKFYLEQDALYLREFSKALMLLSKRLPDRRHALQFRLLSNYIVEAELNLHLRYLRGATPFTFFSGQRPPIKKIPIISHYTDHLFYTIKNAPIEVSVASCVPCFWMYNNIGKEMAALSSEKNPYRNWIASYSSDRFTFATTLIVETASELTGSVTSVMLQEQITTSFLNSLRFELQFFNAAIAYQNNHENLNEHAFHAYAKIKKYSV